MRALWDLGILLLLVVSVFGKSLNDLTRADLNYVIKKLAELRFEDNIVHRYDPEEATFHTKHGHANTKNVDENQQRGFRCGQSAVNVATRVVGGDVSTPYSAPWVVSYRVNGYHICGASVLSSRYVLTAAHCAVIAEEEVRSDGTTVASWHARDARTVTVVGAEFDQNVAEGVEQERRVAEIIPHPDYDSVTSDNDLAILRLEEGFTFNQYLRPACVPTEFAGEENGHYCIAAGWGKTMNVNEPNNILREAELPIMNRETCKKDVQQVTRNMFCAGWQRGGTDTCQGDSGTPLYCPQDGQWVQQGLVSFGVGCAQPGHPGVYTRLSNYAHWIRTVTEGTAEFF